MRPREEKKGSGLDRLMVLRILFATAGLVIVGQLFRIQVIGHGFYEALASGQHEIFRQLFPERGRILSKDGKTGEETLLATNRKLTLVFAEPYRVEDPEGVADALAGIFGWEEETRDDYAAKLADKERRYLALARKVPDDVKAKIEALELPGILFTDESHRFYPEGESGAQVLGFVGAGSDGGHEGKYGVEGYFESELAGSQGYLSSTKDAGGRLTVVGDHTIQEAEDGADIVLTIDRTLQHVVCAELAEWVESQQAERGSVVVMDPKTGAIVAMCNAPVFDPNEYNLVERIDVYNNTSIFSPYEPGSVFKAVTMAAGLDTGKVTPDTVFNDEGEVKIGPYTIRNSDLKAHGEVTMTDVITESLNTGMVDVASRLGPESFLAYVRDFGFGRHTGIETQTELAGDIEALAKRGDIWSATGSFGQGITVTLLQLVQAYSAMANGGVMMKPYLIDEIRYDDGTADKRSPKMIRRVIDARTAKLITGMLVAVVERGHGTRAAVPGYWLAGKTGTAQIARSDGGGYEAHDTIGSFIGFGPIEDPRFVIGVRIDRPQTVRFAESSAAPLFGRIADFLVDYYQIPPTRH